MPVTVSIPTPLRPFTAGLDTVELAGDTVGEVLSALVGTHGGLRRHLMQDDGRLRNSSIASVRQLAAEVEVHAQAIEQPAREVLVDPVSNQRQPLQLDSRDHDLRNQR